MAVNEVSKNPIGLLQEVCQVWKIPLPSYSECGGSYQEFGTEVRVSFPLLESVPAEQVELKALGRTKKASKTKAAQEMLDHISLHRPQLMQRPPVVRLTIYQLLFQLCVCVWVCNGAGGRRG